MLILIWAALISGFGFNMVRLNNEGKLHFSPIVYIHIILYTAWQLLLTIQILLIRTKNLKLHKKLGLTSFGLIPLMIIFGITTALLVAKRDYGMPGGDLNFTCVQFGNVIMFSTLASAGIYLRKNYTDHKRLMLMAAIILTEPGFSRWMGFKTAPFFGDFFWNYKSFHEGFGRFWVHEVLPQFVLFLFMAGYDFYTRKKIPKVFYWGFLLFLTITTLEGILYYSNTWHSLMKSLIDMI
jgi:uncharacterized membrane protein YozB (DUF420 family)